MKRNLVTTPAKPGSYQPLVARRSITPNTIADGIGPVGVLGEAFRNYTDNSLQSREEMEAEAKKDCISRQIKNDACLKGKPYTAKYKATSKNAAIEHDMHSHVELDTGRRNN